MCIRDSLRNGAAKQHGGCHVALALGLAADGLAGLADGVAFAEMCIRDSEMAALREAADELEELVPQTYWPMPDYCELLFDL